MAAARTLSKSRLTLKSRAPTRLRSHPAQQPTFGRFGGAVDVVLGVSMAPETVRMVLVEGESAGGLTVDQAGFDVTADATPRPPPTTSSRPSWKPGTARPRAVTGSNRAG